MGIRRRDFFQTRKCDLQEPKPVLLSMNQVGSAGHASALIAWAFSSCELLIYSCDDRLWTGLCGGTWSDCGISQDYFTDRGNRHSCDLAHQIQTAL